MCASNGTALVRSNTRFIHEINNCNEQNRAKQVATEGIAINSPFNCCLRDTMSGMLVKLTVATLMNEKTLPIDKVAALEC